jgi:hypothetical protein
MSDTPETDDQPIIYALNELEYQVLCVDLEFARKLERERDEARERECAAIDSWWEEHQRALREGQRVVVVRGAIRALAEHGEVEIQRLTKERDETMEALKKCREDSICYAEHMRRCGYSAAYKESQENADRATIILNKHKEGAK